MVVHHAGGLSPLVRGNRRSARRWRRTMGSIPACAGEPALLCAAGSALWVYPRLCGGTACSAALTWNWRGLSPLVRGNHQVGVESYGHIRSIPACAGEPLSAPSTRARCRVYPRLCGGTGLKPCYQAASGGLSPLVRGNHSRKGSRNIPARSIPACAGEPRGCPDWGYPCSVYPRLCGGTPVEPVKPSDIHGLSPLVRGNPDGDAGQGRAVGSIPACAGEPRYAHGKRTDYPVYPRLCGGTCRSRGRNPSAGGLSPLVRGNHNHEMDSVGWDRSIPACAGEPPDGDQRIAESGVYPRLCGGTYWPAGVIMLVGGLSPLVRGNRRLAGFAAVLLGSIPACAGEPRPGPPVAPPSGVYPRLCGGTRLAETGTLGYGGLSPLVRGNRPGCASSNSRQGSIPACAGEPLKDLSAAAAVRVYPRLCGGTHWAPLSHLSWRGLSPLVRGNPDRLGGHLTAVRSIPACAGEPTPCSYANTRQGVYPRLCGGTNDLDAELDFPNGLSPLVRGNQRSGRRTGLSKRSIPACAGEPRLQICGAGRVGVYPRLCGGTDRYYDDGTQGEGLSPLVRGNRHWRRCPPFPPRSIPACAGEPGL